MMNAKIVDCVGQALMAILRLTVDVYAAYLLLQWSRVDLTPDKDTKMRRHKIT